MLRKLFNSQATQVFLTAGTVALGTASIASGMYFFGAGNDVAAAQGILAGCSALGFGIYGFTNATLGPKF